MKCATILVLLALVVGCSGGLSNSGCKSEKARDIKRLGQPSEACSVFQTNGFKSTTCWWYSQGISRTYTAAEFSGCEVSTFRFEPI